MGIVSYAQNFEDVLLHRVFASTNYAFYVDIGAYHPVTDSVTKSFYDRGWDGINVEPGEVFDELAACRPRDINLNMAVYDHSGTISFAQHPGWYAGLSHVLAEAPAPGAAISSQPQVETRTVACDTLTNILDRYGSGRPIAFLKIDAEGSEAKIIRSTDWQAIRPTVIVIEATKPRSTVLDNADWEPVLLEQGFQRAYFDGINCFYVPVERADLLRHFELPVNALDGFIRFDPQLQAAQLQAGAAEAKTHEVTAELARANAESASQIESRIEQNTALKREFQSTQAQLEMARQSLASLAGVQSQAVAAVVQANTYQVSDLHRQLADMQRDMAELHRQLSEQRGHAAALEDRCAGLLRERNELLAVRDEAIRLRRLMRELRWPGGPGALRIVLPLARLLRRLAGTPVPPVPPEELALLALGNTAAAAVTPAAAPPAPPPWWIAQRAAWLAYQPFRLVGRPAAWRLRAFLTLQLHAEFAQLDQKLNRVREELARTPVVHVMPPAPAVDPRLAELQAEIRQFGKLLEDTLLTLALDNGAVAAAA